MLEVLLISDCGGEQTINTSTLTSRSAVSRPPFNVYMRHLCAKILIRRDFSHISNAWQIPLGLQLAVSKGSLVFNASISILNHRCDPANFVRS